MLRARSLLTAASLITLFQPALAAEVPRDGLPLSTAQASQVLIGPGAALPAGLRIDDQGQQWLMVDPRGVVTFQEAAPRGAPTPLTDIPRAALIAAFWSTLQVGPCPNGEPSGAIRWAPTGRGLRVSWIGMPVAGCAPEATRATFAMTLTTDDAGRPDRIELRYEALPDDTSVEPRAGLVMGEALMELLPDGDDAPLRGRAKRLLELGSDRESGSGVWIIELDPRGEIVGDNDGDGVRSADNCPRVSNPWQWNADGDRDGDVCDIDGDDDGIGDLAGDNCPLTPNFDQADRDGDGRGDVCDDSDGDRLVDALDRCPDSYDPAALDMDGDGVPDACDSDIDGDELIRVGPVWRFWLLATDHCPYVADPLRTNSDLDGFGDQCDRNPLRTCKGLACLLEADADGDGIADILDACPTAPDPGQLDGDDDGIGDACDPDLDGDGIPDAYPAAGLPCDPSICGRR